MRKAFLLVLAFVTIGSTLPEAFASTIEPPAAKTVAPSSTEPDAATVKAALDEFKSLSRKERKARLKEVKAEWKAYKKAKKEGKEPSDNTVLLCILAVLLPPLAVYLHEGEINSRFWISLLLTLLFW
ncbi:MAG TPA: YqaE/Pmp3 family membrane protein, partial [Chitinophagaceae bacterium]|nr:YqaE/Pmp3 family membrane protein [Chitinophagaceae bacterium]